MMQTQLPSASKIGLAETCDASTVYDQTETVRQSGERGTAIHKFVLTDAPKFGRDDALRLVPEKWRATCAAIDLDGLPFDAKSYAVEVAFAWDHATDDGRELGRNLGRKYPKTAATEYRGTADLVALLDPDGVFVGDVKSGFMPPHKSQLKTLALAASRTYKRKWVRCEFIFVPEDDEPYRRGWTMDALDLDDFADELRERAARISKARAEYEKGIEPRATMGEHCRWCSSLAHCKPSQEIVRAFAPVTLDIAGKIAALTPEEKGRMWVGLKQVKLFAEGAERILKASAEQDPFPLPNGKMLTMTDGGRREVDGPAAYQALLTTHGAEVAEKAAPAERNATIKSVAAAIGSKPGKPDTEALLTEWEQTGVVRRQRWREAKEVDPKALKAEGE
ncbi:MAG: hypothetical protein AAB922_05635 [Patescibacteria group bacterium]